ncbi:enoyl-CoA hydratase-related protein [Novosphingobium sp. TH158]|uniref:enoyl-CoA hydratase-related protein n=1 Tax=Novosphingobium sp. TH158 TaxID=2067455 RepID=UPI000C7C9652|nr:enoyl-CoA hydratase-related protein [Novosphingobium sp. TH158]PLK26094.1 enoyl-CoA hydratase [Novosphingobium sp. TH158]
MSYETLIVEQRGAVTLIQLNRPQALNALNSTVMKDLAAAMAAFEADESQGCVVLTGAGEKAFAAGADIPEMANKPATDFFAEAFFDGWQKDIAHRVRKPWIAAVHGFALGGGCELAMMADMIIASEKARFGQPEIKLGVAPGMGGTQRLTRAVGKAKAMDLCLTGRMMDAAEAEQCGLVARVLPVEGFVDAVVAIAAEIAAMPRMAALLNKEMVNVAFETTLEQGLLYERRTWGILAATEDKAEGMNAFVEKRPAVWKNR